MDLLIALEHLLIVLQLIPNPLDQLLEEGVGDRVHELLLPRVDSAVPHSLCLHDDVLDAEEVDLVDVVDEEEVVGLRVYHVVLVEHQALQVDLFDHLFDVLVVEHCGDVDQVRADRVDVESDEAPLVLILSG